MSAPLEFVQRGGGIIRLERYLAAAEHLEARCVGRRLRILAVVGQPHHHLRMPLRLHRTAHQAEAHNRRAVPHQETGDNRLERALARADAIGMSLLQHKARAPVLQADSRARHDHAGTKALVIGLDKGDHHAAVVGGRQIDCPAPLWHAVARLPRRIHINQRRACCQIRRIEQIRNRDIHRLRIGDKAIGVGQCQLDGLDLHMQAVGRVRRMRRQVFVVENAQGDQRRQALPIGGNFVQSVAAVVLARGADPIALVRRQIVGVKLCAVRCRGGGHLLGQVATVIGLALRLGNPLQRPRLVGTGKFLTRLRNSPPRHKGLGKTRHLGQDLRLPRPRVRRHRPDQIAIAGIAHRRRKEVGEGQFAKALRQLDPGRHATGRGHRVPTPAGHRIAPGEVLRRPARRRAPRGIETVQFFAVP